MFASCITDRRYNCCTLYHRLNLSTGHSLHSSVWDYGNRHRSICTFVNLNVCELFILGHRRADQYCDQNRKWACRRWCAKAWKLLMHFCVLTNQLVCFEYFRNKCSSLIGPFSENVGFWNTFRTYRLGDRVARHTRYRNARAHADDTWVLPVMASRWRLFVARGNHGCILGGVIASFLWVDLLIRTIFCTQSIGWRSR